MVYPLLIKSTVRNVGLHGTLSELQDLPVAILSALDFIQLRSLQENAKTIATQPATVRGIGGAGWLAEWVQETLAEQTPLEDFIAQFADHADHPEGGLALLEFWIPALGPPSPHQVDGDWIVEEPTLVHGDLRVEGLLDAREHLLVTGSIHAHMFNSDYDSRTTVLGDVDCLALTTDGATYIGGALRAPKLVWTYGEGWTAAAKRCVTQLYINQNDHPDEWGELVAEESFEVRGPAALRGIFLPELMNDKGEIRRSDVLDWIRQGREFAR